MTTVSGFPSLDKSPAARGRTVAERPEPYDFAGFDGYEQPRFTQIPNEFLDHHLASLSGSETKVLLYIMRRTLGFDRRTCDAISLRQMTNGLTTPDGRQLDRGVGLAKSSLCDALISLETKGLIIRERRETPANGSVPTIYHLRMRSTPPCPAPGHPPVQPPDTPCPDTGHPSSLIERKNVERKNANAAPKTNGRTAPLRIKTEEYGAGYAKIRGKVEPAVRRLADAVLTLDAYRPLQDSQASCETLVEAIRTMPDRPWRLEALDYAEYCQGNRRTIRNMGGLIASVRRHIDQGRLLTEPAANGSTPANGNGNGMRANGGTARTEAPWTLEGELARILRVTHGQETEEVIRLRAMIERRQP